MFLASYIGRRVWKDNYTDIEGDLMKVCLFGGTFDPPHKGLCDRENRQRKMVW